MAQQLRTRARNIPITLEELPRPYGFTITIGNSMKVFLDTDNRAKQMTKAIYRVWLDLIPNGATNE